MILKSHVEALRLTAINHRKRETRLIDLTCLQDTLNPAVWGDFYAAKI